MLVSGREDTKREWEHSTTTKHFKRSMWDNLEGRNLDTPYILRNKEFISFAGTRCGAMAHSTL